ncbi:hypothetical protein B0O99DRAFT_624170 [Bisporella sp. PMI_857]|nr:hypothetical protein B0O99DRAFT_624170 [Bisporella sp. PMI_857]
MAVTIDQANEGIRNLETLVHAIKNANIKLDKSTPIVLVSGFSGWGEPLLGTFNYWGGFEDLPLALSKEGYTIIVVRIGPFSSNWERACEIYAQLTAGLYDEPTIHPCAPDSKINIDFGDEFPEKYGYSRISKTKRSILFGGLPSGWEWGKNYPAHFICHSQGGNTMRLLAELLDGTHENLHKEYFPSVNRQNWIKSIVTIGTPHKGTTITNVVQKLLPADAIDLITRLMVSVTFRYPRVYDLQLDHRGIISAKPGQAFLEMYTLLKPLVKLWWEGPRNLPPHNGFYDNSVAGVRELNNMAYQPSPYIYYFTMSFDATQEFPDEHLTADDVATFPIFPLNILPGPLKLLGYTSASFLAMLSRLPGLPSAASFVKWLVQVANNHLRPLGYFSQIPVPGRLVPRPDMLPLLLVTAVGMGGWESSQKANLIALDLPPNVTSKEFQANDGVVNTASMKGPNDAYILDGTTFAVQNLASFPLSAKLKGIYWHMGISKTIDHADEIGVFTEGETFRQVRYMYQLFGELLASLPSAENSWSALQPKL